MEAYLVDPVTTQKRDALVVGVGMHPWGRWRRGFQEYAVFAARAALADANVRWPEIQFISAAGAIRSGIEGVTAGNSISRMLGWQGAAVQTSYGACVSGAQALAAARSRILSDECDLALVVGSDESTQGPLLPSAFHRSDDLDAVGHRMGLSNVAYLGLAARRRMEIFGTTIDDFAHVKVKNSRHAELNPNARFRCTFTQEQVQNSPIVCDPLRLFHLSSTSDGAAAVVLASREYARRRGLQGISIAAACVNTPRFPSAGILPPGVSSDSTIASPGREYCADAVAEAYAKAGIGPDDISFAEVYDLSSSEELDWYEHLGFCRRGAAEALLRSGESSLAGRRPVNPSGGLMSFGEAPSAQVLAQVCELVWQLRGTASRRQVENARTAIAASRGAHGNAAAIIMQLAS